MMAQPGVKLGVEIAHDAAIALAAPAHGLQKCLAIGIEQLKLAALQPAAPVGHHIRITAGILHVIESAGGKGPVQDLGGDQPLIGVGAFIEAQLGIGRQRGQQPLGIGQKDLVALVVGIQAVGDEDQRVRAGGIDLIQFLHLILKAVRHMAGRDHGEGTVSAALQLLGPGIDGPVQRLALLQRQPEDLAGLADGKNAIQTGTVVPIHILQGHIQVYSAIGFIRGDHGGENIHRRRSFILFFCMPLWRTTAKNAIEKEDAFL